MSGLSSQSTLLGCALQLYETTIRKNDPNLIEVFSGLEQFGSRYMIEKRLMSRMLTVTEELCIQTVMPMLKSNDKITGEMMIMKG